MIEQRSGVEAGCWGGLLTLGAKVRGVEGVAADGPLRDVDEPTRTRIRATAMANVSPFEHDGKVRVPGAARCIVGTK